MRLLLNIFYLLFVIIYCCECKTGFGPGEQDWDYVEVRPDAHMFWWLYYNTENITRPESKPLLIWLQGGPGGSSTGIGNFQELGPLDSKLNPRNSTWVKQYNVLFIDSPVGTGFSYVKNQSALTKNNTQAALDLIECLRGFYKKLPEFQNSSVYITAQSYGGKIAIEFALLLDKAIKQGQIKSNIKGVALIDSWISPIDYVTTWASFLLQVGSIDNDGFIQIDKEAKLCKQFLNEGKFEAATDQWLATEITIQRITRNIDFYNILSKINTSLNSFGDFLDLPSELNKPKTLTELMNTDVKNTLNIPDHVDWKETNRIVFHEFSEDFMKPAIHLVEEVLNTTSLKVYVVSGQLDLIVDTPGTYKWVMDMNFKDKQNWLSTSRDPLIVNDIIEGFMKSITILHFIG
ncbi:retinoid-inducible serine carboxypeptidase-like [Chrysoperla carnea]|uniref:retinoid-inducible serine carboxypeptidase-like n=1 Tax=Chrysoperla carnea TaxID=189513 RepID=UPI001D06C8AC|nr:retinoid-inducible serine carboxypeptidase-like [Chrysoperla carnea]